MKIAVLKERYPGERRVALTPANVPQLAKLGIEVLIERGAGVFDFLKGSEQYKFRHGAEPRQLFVIEGRTP